MEISKIAETIKNMGYDPYGISSTGSQDAQKLAQTNGITVEEAQAILKEAEQQTSAMLDLLSSQDEEEIVEFDDADFDNFLNQTSSEEQMQNIFSKQQVAKTDNEKSQTNGNIFSQNDNPFLKPAW